MNMPIEEAAPPGSGSGAINHDDGEIFDAEDAADEQDSSAVRASSLTLLSSTAEEAPIHFSHRSSEFEDSCDKKLLTTSERTYSVPDVESIDEAVIVPSDDGDVAPAERDTVSTLSSVQNRPTVSTLQSTPSNSTASSPPTASLPVLRATVVEEPTDPVYDGVQVASDDDLPWWKRHLLLSAVLVLLSLAAVIVVAVIATRNNNGDGDGELESLITPSTVAPTSVAKPSDFPPSTRPSTCETYRATPGEPLLDFCDNCYPSVDMDSDDVVTGSIFDIRFFNHQNETFQQEASFTYNSSTTSIAISGDVAVIGERRGTSTYAAQIFEKNSSGMWSQVMEIDPDNSALDASFGQSVDVDGDVVVIGAPKADIGMGGSAFVYRRLNGTWLQEAMLLPDDPVQAFGQTVTVKGDFIAVGDPIYGDAYQGAVYIYQYDSASNSWDQLADASITNEDCTQFFGSVAEFTEDNQLVIGCYVGAENPAGGVVFSYSPSGERGQYEVQQAVVPSSGVENFNEIDQMAVNGNFMLVTAFLNEHVFLFARDENNVWKEVQELSAPGSSTELESELDYGYTVALFGRTALVSSRENVYSFFIEDC
jgi:hypothetical protein